jgi:HEAT repeat protein
MGHHLGPALAGGADPEESSPPASPPASNRDDSRAETGWAPIRVPEPLEDDEIWEPVELTNTDPGRIEPAPSVERVAAPLRVDELDANDEDDDDDDSWEGVDASIWDEPPTPKASSRDQSATIPDLGTEAWLRASSETVRPRPLPVEVLERASRPDDSEADAEAASSDPASDFEREVEARLGQLEHPMKRVRGMAREALAAMGSPALPYIAARFPGPLTVNPFAPEVVLPPFAECGPLLSLVAHHGREAHPHVLGHLDAPDPVIRFFATYFYSMVYVPEAIPRLIQRLHDEEARICMTAARTLFGYRSHSAFGQVLDHLHGRLAASSLAARRHATYLIGLFRDVSAIPSLIGILERKERALLDVAEAALSEITKQRFGANARKWRSWLKKNEHRNRIEWLIDGLASKDHALRKSACEELRAVTGKSFGFDPEAPRRQRDRARHAWLEWWQDQEREASVQG